MKFETAIKYMSAMASNLNPALLQRETKSFVIDSREVQAGDVFFALSQPEYQNNGFNGEFEDATSYASTAMEKGAVACVLRTDRFAQHKQQLDKYSDKLVFVDDAILALQRLAHGVYLDWGGPIVAITGSAGKTTAKELTAHVLASTERKVLRNIKNYNNGLGHPLTVLNLAKDASYDVAVLEMGMSTPMHEIQRLCRITPPDVAVELNVLPVHVEHLGSIENVAIAKAELIEGMKPAGTALLNADDDRVLAMRALAKGNVITFAIDSDADVRASSIVFERFGETRFILKTPTGTAPVNFPLNGKHNILNALAAASVGHSFGMSAEEIATSLAAVEPPPQRGEVLHFKDGFTVINDSYNSNPTALLSMVQTLIEGGSEAMRRIVIAGEMLELGADERRIHSEVGEKLGQSGIDMLIGVRSLASEMVEGAVAAGLRTSVFTENSEEAGDLLLREIRPGDLVLIKGSRGVQTEKVLQKLLGRFEVEGKESIKR